jgi:hypothetical protein
VDLSDIAMVNANVTCHTEGCQNAGITIFVTAQEESLLVICGPCGAPITDVDVLGPARSPEQ